MNRSITRGTFFWLGLLSNFLALGAVVYHFLNGGLLLTILGLAFGNAAFLNILALMTVLGTISLVLIVLLLIFGRKEGQSNAYAICLIATLYGIGTTIYLIAPGS